MRESERHALVRKAFFTNNLTDALELVRHALVGNDDVVDGIGDLARQTRSDIPTSAFAPAPSEAATGGVTMTGAGALSP